MTKDNRREQERFRLFSTPEHHCSYLPGLHAQTTFIDPDVNKDPILYQSLLNMGFRRSGSEIYRPDCLNL